MCEKVVSRIEEATKDIVMDNITIKQHIKERVERNKYSKWTSLFMDLYLSGVPEHDVVGIIQKVHVVHCHDAASLVQHIAHGCSYL